LDTQRLPFHGWKGLLGAALALSHALEAEMDHALAVVRLSARGFVALGEIAAEPPCSQGALATRLGLEASTTSELLKRLERRGLIEKERAGKPGPSRPGRSGRGRAGTQLGRAPGRPATPVAITAEGRVVLAKAERIAVEVEDDWAKRIAVAAGSPYGFVRASGLRRWLCESWVALASEPSGASSKRECLKESGANSVI
jgi:DNA-binding transcriptional ArsR family regulator